MKAYISADASKKVDRIARAYAAHEDGEAAIVLPEWRARILAQMIKHGDIVTIRACKDNVESAYLVMLDEIKNEAKDLTFYEFEVEQ